MPKPKQPKPQIEPYRHRVLRVREFFSPAAANEFLDSVHVGDVREIVPIRGEGSTHIVIAYYAYPEAPDPERTNR